MYTTRKPFLLFLNVSFSAALLTLPASAGDVEPGFTPLFNGHSLQGWKLVGQTGEGYVAKDGVLAAVKGGGGNLFTEKEYGDFILRFEFKLEPGSNNGVGIRAPLEGDAAYMGMEIQVLDDAAPKYASLRPEQYHGSIYDVIAAKRGALKPAGEWNQEEITCDGRRVKVVVNGQPVVDADLNTITDPAVLAKHPGLLRAHGRIGFLGHNDYVEFRNIRIQEKMPAASGGDNDPRPDAKAPARGDNTPPQGFVALFNGKDLTGWKGLLAPPNDNPSKRAALPSDQLAAAQAKADESMRQHWKVENGALVFDGKGLSLATAKDYADFEMLVDWKILPKGDSGIYLRGSPQVQIWDNPLGSGGLYNNKKNPSNPSLVADKPVGEWNTFRLLMIGEKLTVFLNEQLVTHNVTMENYWEPEKAIYPTGQIELQNHGNTLWFKNIYIRELPGK